MSDPGRRLARGRSADVFDLGDGRVLRRRRTGVIPDAEVVAMRVVRDHAYPAPRVLSVDGADMIMERLDGDDLLAVLARRPWRVRRIGRTLAELHCRLAEIPCDAPDVSAAIPVAIEPAEAIVHGDLHPGNVLVTSRGPVVIDWEGASLGPSDADVATTWLLLAIADADGVPLPTRPLVSLIRRVLIRSFLTGVPSPRAATVDAVCRRRLGDPNLRPVELERIRRFRESLEAFSRRAPVGADDPVP